MFDATDVKAAPHLAFHYFATFKSGEWLRNFLDTQG
jgi:hypothetical protein